MSRRTEPGRCQVCGCTDDRGCAVARPDGHVGGCWWVDRGHTLCSRCAWNMSVFVLALKRARRLYV